MNPNPDDEAEKLRIRLAYQGELYDYEQALAAMREKMRTLRGSRQLSLVVTKIEEAEHWLRDAREHA